MDKLIELLRQVYRLENTQKKSVVELGKSLTGKSGITRSQYFLILHLIRKYNLAVNDWAEIRVLINEPLAILDPISNQSWFTTTSLHCSKRYWEQIGILLKGFHQSQCAVCDVQKTEDEIDIQELWHFDDKLKIQKLVCYYPICISCQDHSYMPNESDKEELESFVEFFKKVNKWSTEQAIEHINQALALQKMRDQSDWIVDVEYLVSELNIQPNSFRENVFDHDQKQSVFHCMKSIQEDAREEYNLKVEIDCRFSIF